MADPVLCTDEGGECVIPAGETWTGYWGVAPSQLYAKGGLTSLLQCGASHFDGVDPAPGSFKHCYYTVDGAEPPSHPASEAGGSTTVTCTVSPCVVSYEHHVTVTANIPMPSASDAGGVMTPAIHLEMFWQVAGLLVVVWLGVQIKNFFWRSGGDHA